MRPDNTFSQKTNITSLATIAGVMAFVVWMTSFAARPDSIVVRAPQTSAASAAPSSTPRGAADAQPADNGAATTAKG